MAREIERKFLVQGDEWRELAKGAHYKQGYLSTKKECAVRVRSNGIKGFLTIKGINVGATRQEFEYEIPLVEAVEILQLCEKPIIEKKRYKIDFAGFTWEVDEFFGENNGLLLAEIELDSEDQTFEKPAWIGKEVTNDPRYYNANLVKNPFTAW